MKKVILILIPIILLLSLINYFRAPIAINLISFINNQINSVNENINIEWDIPDNIDIDMITVGADYTLPIATGVLIMTESMFIYSKQNTTTSDQKFSVFMVSLPLGMFHNVMLISSLDWDENNTYNYLRWSSAYDNFSINCMASINPNEVGNSFQLMFIYNH